MSEALTTPRPPSARAQALVSMVPAFALLALATIAIVLLSDRIPPAGLAFVALLGGLPSVVMISRGWNRVLWANRIDRARHAAAAAPDDPELAYELGVLLSLRGETEEARRAYEMARRIRPGFAPATVGLGHLCVENDDLAGALEYFQAAAEADPELFSAHYGIAGVWVRREQFARAVAAFDRALALDPDDGYVLVGLARCHFELSELERAREYLQRAGDRGVNDRELERAIEEADAGEIDVE